MYTSLVSLRFEMRSHLDSGDRVGVYHRLEAQSSKLPQSKGHCCLLSMSSVMNTFFLCNLSLKIYLLQEGDSSPW